MLSHPYKIIPKDGMDKLVGKVKTEERERKEEGGKKEERKESE